MEELFAAVGLFGDVFSFAELLFTSYLLVDVDGDAVDELSVVVSYRVTEVPPSEASVAVGIDVDDYGVGARGAKRR